MAAPFRDAYGWFAGLIHAKSENARLRAEVDRLRSEAIQNRNAVLEANDFIAKNPRESAEIFVKIENTKLPVPFIEKMISDPEFSYAPEPENVMKIYGFMHKVGALKNMPAGWQDLFFPEAHGLKGN